MRIRCPDASPSNSVIFVPQPNPSICPKPKLRPLKPRKKVARATRPVAPPARKSSSSRRREQIPGKLKRTDSASLAAKKGLLRTDTKVKLEGKPKEGSKRSYSFVYAGNLLPTITKERLDEIFTPCGPVLRIIIRCSRGHVVRVLPEGVRPELFFGPRDRQYASIEFSDSMAYLRALQLNGQWLDGAQMIVCKSAADLPEAKEAPRSVPATPKPPAEPPRVTIPQSVPKSPVKQNGPYRTPVPVPLNVQLELPTKPPETPATAEGGRFQFLGLSFAKCII